MTVSSTVARPMLAGIFVYAGADAAMHPETKAEVAANIAPIVAGRLGVPTDPVTLVRINGAVQVGAGLLLAIGKLRRLAALALIGSLIPTTLAGHQFWSEADPTKRQHQRIQFLKNLAMLGGLILAAADTGGRPSVTWRARRASKLAVKASMAAGAGAGT
ncbi:MAG: DoxX family protein, partial [Actinomycetota bacterium]|nr:DoxX family protein [Actinomycetota bacterium]